MGHYVQHANSFAGYPVLEWNPSITTVENPSETAIAIRIGWDESNSGQSWVDRFNTLLKHNFASQIPALIIGAWSFEYDSSIESVIAEVIAKHESLPNLKAIFVADLISEEQEISWINQGDLSPLLKAFPDLEHLAIRGGDGLKLGNMDMPKLKSLRIETGGMDRSVVHSIGSATLPELESLVLWLGDDGYGATTTIPDLQPFYECANMPKIKHLGLCNSRIADEIAVFMATAPVLQRLDILELSMGTLGDEGGLALLTSPYIRSLKKLDLHFHFMSDAMQKKILDLQDLGIQVNVDHQNVAGNWRFVAVSE